MSAAYLVHFFFIMVINFFCIVLASWNIYTSKKSLNELMKTQIDHLYEIMGMDSAPYIVTKVVRDAIELPVTHKTSHAFRSDVS